jgi:Protein of unknown function (DUF3618)
VSASNGHRPTPTAPDVLRAEIAQTRMELGETVSALAAKVDVKSRAQEMVGQMRGELTARARHTADEVRGRLSSGGGLARRLGPNAQWPMIGAVAALTLLLVGIATRRRRG